MDVHKEKQAVRVLIIAALVLFGSSAMAVAEEFTFGLLMVGPYNDHGWSQAHYEAGRAVEKEIKGAKMIYIDKVNPADRPGLTVPMLVDDLVAKGAKLIIANSDDMKDGVREAALLNPHIFFVHISGDDALTGKGPDNLTNLMGRMEYTKMMAGFAAAMTSKTGKIGYLGPLINEETRRLAVACYLGAKHAWTAVRKKPAADLKFNVAWIGFWFNIPGVTLDPTQVARTFFDSGHDVVVSGIDTVEALSVANSKRQAGKDVWALPYDYEGACQSGPKACLGVPYFNWTPGFLTLIKRAMTGKWKQEWLWLGPDWQGMNNHATSSVGFQKGEAMSDGVKARLDDFIGQLADGRVQPFSGPLNFQDGTVFLKKGETASDKQIWYLPQLLQGMEGQSSPR